MVDTIEEMKKKRCRHDLIEKKIVEEKIKRKVIKFEVTACELCAQVLYRNKI